MNPFEYTRANDVAEAIRLHESDPDARYLAGGSNLIDLMKYQVETANRLIDISHLPLTRIEELSGGGLRIGGLVRNSDCAAHRVVRQNYPVLSVAILQGASPQLRNMATTGGNLLQRTRCYYFYDTALPCNKRVPGSGCPAIPGFNRIHAILGQSDQCIAVYPSDMAVALALLDATVNVQGPNGRRSMSIHDFHRLPGATPHIDNNLESGELILSVDLPSLPIAKRSGYVKVRDRNSYAFALVSAACALDLDGGAVREVRIAMGGVAAKPWRAFDAEKFLAGKPANIDSFRQAAEVALQDARGYPDNEFKIELAKRAIVRVLSDLNEGASS